MVQPDVASGCESVNGRYGLISRMGVPFIRSAPSICMTGPSGVSSSIFVMRTEERPILLGLNGERVAHTPIRLLPPSLGGRTVGDHLLL